MDKSPRLPKEVWWPEKARLADFIFIKLLLMYNVVLVSAKLFSYVYKTTLFQILLHVGYYRILSGVPIAVQ